MKRHGVNVNETLAKIVARYTERKRLAASGRTELVRDCAAKMCDVSLWELWILTQE